MYSIDCQRQLISKSVNQLNLDTKHLGTSKELAGLAAAVAPFVKERCLKGADEFGPTLTGCHKPSVAHLLQSGPMLSGCCGVCGRLC